MTSLVKFIFSPLSRAYRLFKYGRVTTFSYFIPAPPVRKTGYREREFDALIFKMTQMGFSLKNVQVEKVADHGTLVVATVQAMTREAQDMKPSQFPSVDDQVSLPETSHKKEEIVLEKEQNSADTSDKVEGLYYID